MKTALKLAPALAIAMGLVAAPAMARDHGNGDRGFAGVFYGNDDGDRDRGHDAYRDLYAYGYGYGHGDEDEDRDQGRKHGWGRGHDRDDDEDDNDQGDRRGYGYYDGRDRRYHKNGHWDNGRRGPPPWARGRDYRSYGYRNIYAVPYGDYRRYDLYGPQPGYRWMRDDGGHYMLVQIASGIISDVLYRAGL